MNVVRLSMAFGLALGSSLGLLVSPASAQSAPSPLQFTNPPGLAVPRVYTHVVRAGKLVFIAGQIGFDEQGKVVGPGMAEQMEQLLKNMKIALASQQADFTNVAKITIFTTSIDEYRLPEVQAIYAKYVGDAKPAATLVQVVRLANPALKLEIEAVAALP